MNDVQEFEYQTPKGYRTTGQAASLLGVSGRTILRWVKSGKVQGAVRERVPGGFRWLIPTGDIDRLRDVSDDE